MKVRATQMGHYGGFIRNVGDIFAIDDETFPTFDETGKPVLDEKGKQKRWGWFTSVWMEKVNDEEPLTPLAKPRPKHPLEAMRHPIEQPRTLSEATTMI